MEFNYNPGEVEAEINKEEDGLFYRDNGN